MMGPEETRALNDIGLAIVEILGGDAEGAFLYAEAGDQWQSSSLYQAEQEKVQAHVSSMALFDGIQELWEAAPDDKKWQALKFEIVAGKFDAAFSYFDPPPPEESEIDRRKEVLRARFGDKPVIYPRFDWMDDPDTEFDGSSD